MKIYLIGIGPGSNDFLSFRAKALIDSADVIIGASRMLMQYSGSGKVFDEYNPVKIHEIIDEIKPDIACVLLSGDVSFYSGAKALVAELSGYDIELIPGISSLSYFGSRIGISYDDACVVSAHGREISLVAKVRDNKKVFALMSSFEDLLNVCEKLIYYGLSEVKIIAGIRLSYEDERVLSFTAGEKDSFKNKPIDEKLVIAYFENNQARGEGYKSISDEEFIRDKVPMTKREVRNISISRLELGRDSHILDIGAGTGSVSIEAALASSDIRVTAIEKKEEAISLIEKNKRKFIADNLTIVKGNAPECLEYIGLHNITHAFIGGSSGKIKDILDTLFKANPEIRVVFNAVSLETIAEITEYVRTRDVRSDAVMVQVSRARELADYHMLAGENPVLVGTITR